LENSAQKIWLKLFFWVDIVRLKIMASKAFLIIDVKSVASCATLELDSRDSISGEFFYNFFLNTKLGTHSLRKLYCLIHVQYLPQNLVTSQ
jgi:hypothetical protein